MTISRARSLNRALTVFFWASFAFVGIIALSAGAADRRVHGITEWVEHTGEVLTALGDLQQSLSEPALRTIQIDRLKSLTTDNPTQQDALDELVEHFNAYPNDTEKPVVLTRLMRSRETRLLNERIVTWKAEVARRTRDSRIFVAATLFTLIISAFFVRRRRREEFDYAKRTLAEVKEQIANIDVMRAVAADNNQQMLLSMRKRMEEIVEYFNK